MIDPKIEKGIKIIKEIIVLWKDFFNLLEKGLNVENLEDSMEVEFDQIKTKLAFRKQYVQNLLSKDVFNEGNDIEKVLTSAPSLILLRTESSLTIATLKGLWHEVYISFNKHIGVLKRKQEEMTHVSVSSYRMDKFKNFFKRKK